jgi:hypothetical protein
MDITTCVFAVDPNPVLGWLGEAAEHLEAFSRYVWREVASAPGPRDELCA